MFNYIVTPQKMANAFWYASRVSTHCFNSGLWTVHVSHLWGTRCKEYHCSAAHGSRDTQVAREVHLASIFCDLMWSVSRWSLLRTLSLKCPDIGAMCCMRTEPGSRGASQQLSTEPTPCLASTAARGKVEISEDWRIGGGSSMEHGLWRKLSFAAFLLPSRSHPCVSHWNFQKQNRMISRLIKRTKPTQSPCKQCQTRTGSLYGTSRHKVMEWGMRNHEKIIRRYGRYLKIIPKIFDKNGRFRLVSRFWPPTIHQHPRGLLFLLNRDPAYIRHCNGAKLWPDVVRCRGCDSI